MINPSYQAAFRHHLETPLLSVLGRPLTHVDYLTLSSDTIGYDVAAPNESGGCQALDLFFGETRLTIFWCYDPALTGYDIGAIAYHIGIDTQGDEHQDLIRDDLITFSADAVSPWAGLIRQPVASVAVHGYEGSPQMIRFGFPAGDAVVAVGMTGAGLKNIGDGDEVLVFETVSSAEGWGKWPQEWQPLWSASV